MNTRKNKTFKQILLPFHQRLDLLNLDVSFLFFFWNSFTLYTLFFCSFQRPKYSQLPVWRPCLCLRRMLPSPKDRGHLCTLLAWIMLFRKLLFFPPKLVQKTSDLIWSVAFTVYCFCWMCDCVRPVICNEFTMLMSIWPLTWYVGWLKICQVSFLAT